MRVRRCAAIALAAAFAAGMLPAQEYAGHPERFGARTPELRGGDNVSVRVRLDSLAVAAVINLSPSGVAVVTSVRVLEPGQHDLPVTRIVRTGEYVRGTQRVPFTISRTDGDRGGPMVAGVPPARSPVPRATGMPGGPPPVQAILILADAPLDSAAFAARIAEGIAVHPDSLVSQIPPAVIRDPTTVWASFLLQRR